MMTVKKWNALHLKNEEQNKHDSRVLKALQFLCMNLTETEIKTICIRGALKTFGMNDDARRVFGLLEKPKKVVPWPIVDINNKISNAGRGSVVSRVSPVAEPEPKSEDKIAAKIKDKPPRPDTIEISDDEDENMASAGAAASSTSSSIAPLDDEEFLQFHLQGPHADWLCEAWVEAKDQYLSNATFVAELRKALGGA
jgi:hypothetical protein